MPSSTEICNLAISHLGVGKTIENLDTDQTSEAKACRVYYTTARDAVFRDFHWPFATTFASLGLVEEQPTTEWGYSYRYPSDCVQFIRILSGIRNDTRQTRVPYKIVRDATGLLIYSDAVTPVGEYTFRESDSDRYPPDFTMAFSFRLAMYVAPRITGGDQFRLREGLLRVYQSEIGMARATAGNEEQPEDLPQSEFVNARD